MPTTTFHHDFPVFTRILYQAKLSPSSTALSMNGRDVPYSEFISDIENLTHNLYSKLNSFVGVVAVCISDPYLHWVSVIALARLNLVSISKLPYQLKDFFHECFGVLLADQNFELSDQQYLIEVNHDLLKSNDSLPSNFCVATFDFQAPVRIVTTSGTTGHSKDVLLTHGLLLNRLKNITFTYDISSSTRYFDFPPITTICGFHLPLATWLSGGTVIFPDRKYHKYENILRTSANLTFESPFTLHNLLKTIPDNSYPINSLKVFVGGGMLPQEINLKARQKLTSSLFIIYGSTEASVTAYAHASIADKQPNAIGYVLPFVEVQVIDTAGKPIACGVSGEIRIRGEGCVSKYLNDTSTSTDVFRDGWFYPGDHGFLTQDGLLYLSGRTGNLLNLGGFKVSSERIENLLRDCPGVEDVAALSVEDEHGISCPWIFIVPGDIYQQQVVLDKYFSEFSYLPTLHISRINLIPRNDMGKILKEVLRNLAKQQLNRL